MSLRAANRLHCSAEFLTLQRRGIRAQSEHFVLYAGKITSDDANSRLGVTVSRRIGNAVARNRLKRRVHEIYSGELRSQMPAATSLVVIARAGAGELDSRAIRAELARAADSILARMERR